MRTEFFVEYDLYDTTALQDAQEISETNSNFADINLIKDNIFAPNYGTLEHNFFVLDGNMKEFPDEPDNLVYFSSGQSGKDGAFSAKQTIVAHFSTGHSSLGITLYFLEIYPLELEIRWYDIYGILKSKKTFYPNSLVYFCRNLVEDYGRIEIDFIRVLPYHNVKLQHIKYGTTIVWGNDTIKTGKLINDADPTSDKIKTDKLNFEIIDENNEFNLGNAGGIHKLFQRKQSMRPYEIVDGKEIILGTFFLDSNSTTKNIGKMVAIDYKGMLSNADFKEGRMYNGELAGNVIAEIMEVSGIKDYEVDEETFNTPLYGTLKIQSCQKALREVLFACGSIINTSHKLGVEIRKYDRSIKFKVKRDRKFTTTIKSESYVSDVNVKYKTWTLDSNESEIAKGNYGVGIHTIQLSTPAANMTTNIGNIVKQMPYYLVLEIKNEPKAEIVIKGQKYIGEELAVLSSIKYIKSGEVRNTKNFSGTLLDFNTAQAAADRLLNYYQLQQTLSSKFLAESEKAGDWIEIENAVSSYGSFIAAIESLSTDLTGGYISTAKCRGYYKLVADYYYAGSELISGSDMII